MNTNVFGSELWMSMRFNEVCVLGGGECLGSRCDVASRWCLSCLCFLQLMLSREFFMGTAQMVVAIPLCFGCFASPIFVILDIGCFDFASRVAHPLILYIYIYIYIYIIYILYYIYIRFIYLFIYFFNLSLYLCIYFFIYSIFIFKSIYIYIYIIYMYIYIYI